MDLEDLTREMKLVKHSEDDDCGTGHGAMKGGGGNETNTPTGGGKVVTQHDLDILEGALDYLPHSELQECRLVCSDWNTFIKHYPKTFKQRSLLKQLYIDRCDDCPREPVASWTDLPAFQNCCKEELEPLADSMEGKRLSPSLDDAYICTLCLFVRDYEVTPTGLRFPSRFTSQSSFNFLHMLKHLAGSAFKSLRTEAYIDLPFLAAVPLALNCRRVFSVDRWHPSPLSFLLQFSSIATALKPQEIECWTRLELKEEVLEQIVDYGPLPFAVVPKMQAYRRRDFDAALQYLHTRDVRSIVPKVKIRNDLGVYNDSNHWTNWPMARFDPAEAINSVEEQERDNKFIFLRINEQSGRPYRVVIEICEGGVHTVTITFDV